MTTSTTEETAAAPTTATGEPPKATKKARVAKRGAHVAPAKGKATKKATKGKKAPKGKKAVNAKEPTGPRQGSKTEQILSLLTRKDGATLAEIMKATDWQAHSVRGFISGTLGKKMGLTVTSEKTEDGERRYSLKG